jgi:hypothetical protein
VKSASVSLILTNAPEAIVYKYPLDVPSTHMICVRLEAIDILPSLDDVIVPIEELVAVLVR